MAALLIARVRVDDPDVYKAYTLLSKPLIEQYGGKILARGGTTENLEGDDGDVNRVVVVEFPDMNSARNWHSSKEYQDARTIRTPVSEATFTVVESI